MEFNFNRLHTVFVEAIRRHEPTVAFTVRNGPGLFVFLIFIPSDKDGKIDFNKLELSIIMARTQSFMTRELFGNHYNKGDFKVYFDRHHESMIRKELGIENAEEGRFSLLDFLKALNDAFPLTLSLIEKVACIQENKIIIQANLGRNIDQANRIYLLRHHPLTPPKRPREETLRKLFFLTASPKDIADFIQKLKIANWTLDWTDKEPNGDKFADIWQKLGNAMASKK